MAGRMIEQLEAARATGGPVYLAVSDAIGDLLPELEEALKNCRLDVTVLTFSESKLRGTVTRLRAGLALSGGVALVTADQLAEVDDE